MTEPRLVVLGGLPGAGKTTIARALAARLGAVHIRIDTIEQAILRAGVLKAGVEGAGYEVGYGLATDNLRLGRAVVADSVNPIALTRAAWRAAADGAGAPFAEFEIVCGDAALHRARVETRAADIAGHVLPDWAAVSGRVYEPWPEARRVDTSGRTVEACVDEIVGALGATPPPP